MGEPIRSYRDLKAWQHAFQAAVVLYRAEAKFPREERYALGAQLRRAVISISSNIAEGYGRGTTKDYIRFLRMARGSLCETDNQLRLALELCLLERAVFEELMEILGHCERTLAGLIRSLEEHADA